MRIHLRFANSFQDAGGAQSGHIAGILGHIKANAHMRLRCQMIDLIRADIVHNMLQGLADCNVSIMQIEVDFIAIVRIVIDVINSACIKGA